MTSAAIPATALRLDGSLQELPPIITGDISCEMVTAFVGQRLVSMSRSAGRSAAKGTGRLLVEAPPRWPVSRCDALAAGRVVARDFGTATGIAGGNTAGSMFARDP